MNMTADSVRADRRTAAILKTNHELHDADMANDPAYRAAYEAPPEEFTLIAARMRANLTQAELAARMGTTERVVSRLERGRTKPSIRTLQRFADATGHRVSIQLVPQEQGRQYRATVV